MCCLLDPLLDCAAWIAGAWTFNQDEEELAVRHLLWKRGDLLCWIVLQGVQRLEVSSGRKNGKIKKGKGFTHCGVQVLL